MLEWQQCLDQEMVLEKGQERVIQSDLLLELVLPLLVILSELQLVRV